jgi:hypothetical protein
MLYACFSCDVGWYGVSCQLRKNPLPNSFREYFNEKPSNDKWKKVVGGKPSHKCGKLASGTTMHFTGVSIRKNSIIGFAVVLQWCAASWMEFFLGSVSPWPSSFGSCRSHEMVHAPSFELGLLVKMVTWHPLEFLVHVEFASSLFSRDSVLDVVSGSLM